MLFRLGTLAFAVGTMAVAASDLVTGKPLFSKPLALGVLVVAIVGGVGAIAGLFGLAADQVVGASIGLGASNQPDTSDGTDAPPADQEEPHEPSPSPGKGRRLSGHSRP
jgi:hypothetical protein